MVLNLNLHDFSQSKTQYVYPNLEKKNSPKLPKVLLAIKHAVHLMLVTHQKSPRLNARFTEVLRQWYSCHFSFGFVTSSTHLCSNYDFPVFMKFPMCCAICTFVWRYKHWVMCKMECLKSTVSGFGLVFLCRTDTLTSPSAVHPLLVVEQFPLLCKLWDEVLASCTGGHLRTVPISGMSKQYVKVVRGCTCFLPLNILGLKSKINKC